MQKPYCLAELLQYAADKYSDKDFCRFAENGTVHTRSFIEFRNDSSAVCSFIRSRTDESLHIAFISKTCYEYITCLTGMILSGNTVVPFSPDISCEEAAMLFEDADIDILFCEEEFSEKALCIKEAYPALKEIISFGNRDFFRDIFQKYNTDNIYKQPDPDKASLIIYTSGTTGSRKGVMLSDRNLTANSTYNTFALEDADVSFSILPMHHIFCYSCDVLKTLYDGGTVCLNGRMEEMYENFLLFEPTVMRIVPAVCRSLLTKIRIAERRNPDLSPRLAAETIVGKNLRRLIAGSAFLSAAIIDEFEKYGITARQGYGMSECSPRITTADFSQNCKYSNGILTGVDEVRVCDGEIQVRGPSVMKGYYKKPEETAKAFTADGFLHTGDTGYMEGNHIFLTGRKKNIIVLSNGENISPEEIENKYADEELIREIIVFAKGDKLTAEIYAADNTTEKELQQIIDKVNIASSADRHIESFFIRCVPFPKTSTGKIIRQEFRY